MKREFIEKIYAGWLGKTIGIRLGAAIEGWTYQKIKNVYGELHNYPVNYLDFAADDDSNGPLFFLRALEDGEGGKELTAQAVGDALLNYAPYEHGFFWWGGYGISTEHTAYLNLYHGMSAPESGSIRQNGSAVAEQIGGQIFIDTWGLVTPGNPDLAADYAQKAASVTHGGEGVYGGVFVAVCISYAFVETDIDKILDCALSYIPEDCAYAGVVKAVRSFYKTNPRDWRSCYDYIYGNYGYDRYPGNCHIIPNAAVMVLSLLYGEGDFSNTINICNMCGWDTDCNVGNIATIMGVRGGLAAIDYDRWRKPINDFLVCSSVVGSRNLTDVPSGASYINRLAWQVAGEEPPQLWKDIFEGDIEQCHFEYPGSTHAMRVKSDAEGALESALANTDEAAFSGQRSLKVFVKSVAPGDKLFVYKKTHCGPSDLHDSRYDPCFSPLLYPGQAVHGAILLPDYGADCSACLYVYDKGSDRYLCGDRVKLTRGEWQKLDFTIPSLEAGELAEAGFCVTMHSKERQMTVLVDDLCFDGRPNYSIDCAQLREDYWSSNHREIGQFTREKGLLYLEGERLHLSCSDWGEAYTGSHNWSDYTAVFSIVPFTGSHHFVNFRVQGAMRSYAVGFADGQLVFKKKHNGYTTLSAQSFDWKANQQYTLRVDAQANHYTVWVDGEKRIDLTDDKMPYTTGGIGISVEKGSHMAVGEIVVS